jgi:hypothetical protein
MAYFHTNVLDNAIKALPTVGTASGSTASFETDLTEDLIEVVCDIQYSQASGTPSPSNPLPITVYNALNLNHSGADTSNPTVYNIPFGQNVAKGTLNVSTGVLTITDKVVDMGSLYWSSFTFGSNSGFRANLSDGEAIGGASGIGNAACSVFPIVNNGALSASGADMIMAVGAYWTVGCNAYVLDSDYTTASDFKTGMSGNQIVYKLAQPQVIQLSATQITALLNENNIWCDTNGDTKVKFLLSVGKAVA